MSLRHFDTICAPFMTLESCSSNWGMEAYACTAVSSGMAVADLPANLLHGTPRFEIVQRLNPRQNAQPCSMTF